MIVSVPRETVAGERRVALAPREVGTLVKSGLEVVLESGAGDASGYRDQDYEAQGGRTEGSAEAVLSAADVVLKVQPPIVPVEAGEGYEISPMKEGSLLISFIFPASHLDLVRLLAERKITAFAMDLMPRITRAQSMDALSSMSSIAGYRAVLLAASILPRFFPMMMTAAGTITPARVLVLGAGVAGLQAIATARRLGAVVEAFDIRPAVKEQVESLGARFIALEVDTAESEDAGGYAKEQEEETQNRIRELLSQHAARAHVVISTALVPGKRAPLLLSGETVKEMRPGSVIVDLAAEQGGNCEWTEAGQEIVREGVTIAGPLNLPSDVCAHASEMYSRNISGFLLHLIREGKLELDLEDELTRGPLVTQNGEVVHEATRALLNEETVRGEG